MKKIVLNALPKADVLELLNREFGINSDELGDFIEEFEKGSGYYEVVVGSRGEVEAVYMINNENDYNAVESHAEYVSTCVFGDYDSCEDDDIIDEEFFCLDDLNEDVLIIGIEEELALLVVRVA